MISKDLIESIPTSTRDNIAEYLKNCAEAAERNHAEACTAFIHTLDEKQRSVALQCLGEHTAFLVMYNIFNDKLSGGNNAEQTSRHNRVAKTGDR